MLCFHLEKKEAAALTEKSWSDSYQMPKVMLTLNIRGCQPLTSSQKHTLPKKRPQKKWLWWENPKTKGAQSVSEDLSPAVRRRWEEAALH